MNRTKAKAKPGKHLPTAENKPANKDKALGAAIEEIERIVDDTETNRAADLERKEIASLRNKASGLMYPTERSLGELEKYLTDDELRKIRRDLENCRSALDGEDLDILNQALEQLERSSYRIAEVMYEEVG